MCIFFIFVLKLQFHKHIVLKLSNDKDNNKNNPTFEDE